MSTLTRRQKEILAIIRDYIKYQGYPPTVRELCRIAGVASTNGMLGILDKLKKKGYIKSRPFMARSITICERKSDTTAPGAESAAE